MKQLFSWLENQEKIRHYAEGIMSSPKMLILAAAIMWLLATVLQ